MLENDLDEKTLIKLCQTPLLNDSMLEIRKPHPLF